MLKLLLFIAIAVYANGVIKDVSHMAEPLSPAWFRGVDEHLERDLDRAVAVVITLTGADSQ